MKASFEPEVRDSVEISSEGSRLFRFAQEIDAIDKRILFAALVVLYAVQVRYTSTVFFTDELFYRSFGDTLSADRIAESISMQREYQWLSYLALPLLALVKVGFPALCVSIGAHLADYKITFKRLFGIALITEGVFLLSDITEIAWLTYHGVETMQQVENASPLSIYSLFPQGSVATWLSPTLQMLNLFEVLYCIVWIVALGWVLRIDRGRATSLVLASYGTGLLVYLIARTFLKLTYEF